MKIYVNKLYENIQTKYWVKSYSKMQKRIKQDQSGAGVQSFTT